MTTKPRIIEYVNNRTYKVVNKDSNKYQVYFKSKIESKITNDLALILDDYNDYYELQEKGILDCVLLASYKDTESKSLYNILINEPWFDPSVHSLFIFTNNELQTTKYGKISESIKNNVMNITEASELMIKHVKEEQIKSINDIFDEICNHLDLEIKISNKKMDMIIISTEKHSTIFNYGLQIVESEPTISVILLGVSLECLLKQKYKNEIRENQTLGSLINNLRTIFSKELISNLNKINHFYVKAKHEKEFLVTKNISSQLYHLSLKFFQEK